MDAMNRRPGLFPDWGVFVSPLAAGLQAFGPTDPRDPGPSLAVTLGFASGSTKGFSDRAGRRSVEGESLIAALVPTGLSSPRRLLALASGK